MASVEGSLNVSGRSDILKNWKKTENVCYNTCELWLIAHVIVFSKLSIVKNELRSLSFIGLIIIAIIYWSRLSIEYTFWC